MDKTSVDFVDYNSNIIYLKLYNLQVRMNYELVRLLVACKMTVK